MIGPRLPAPATCRGEIGKNRSVLRYSGRANHHDPVTPPNLPDGKPGSGPPPGRKFSAATADVAVTLDITPGVPHVFQAFYPILDEAAAALDRAGQLVSAHLASADRVTA
jgi:hypothetical protein